jgi:glucose/arabinose dehydrogenase
VGLALLAAVLASCSGGGGTAPAPFINPPAPGSLGQPTSAPTAPPTVAPSPAPPPSTPVPTPTPPPATAADPSLHVPAGFIVSTIAHVASARELAALPNGDLIVGTGGSTIAIIPNAESAGAAGSPATFADVGDAPAQGVAYGAGYVFVATQHGVYRIPYSNGAQSGTPAKIASVRTGSVAPNSDGDVHTTSSVAVSGSTLYVGVGSSCNACAETDPTRATVQRMGTDGSGMTTQATRWRNAIALAADPATGAVWAGGAGQDSLAQNHPYEFMDPVSTRTAPADYGWPDCEENHVAYKAGANCANVIVPALEFPAYSTLIGAAFYSVAQSGPYVFPAAWKGGMFVGIHGSWHAAGGVPVDAPHVAFVPFSGASPARPVNWNDPTAQWNDFFTGFQRADGSRIGRPTGVTVGAQGSLFVADDQNGVVYRIRPAASATSSRQRK